MFRRRKNPQPSGSQEPKVVQTPEEKEKARKARMYFNEDTQAAIVAYKAAGDNRKEKERLYTVAIAPAFEKLAENLINIHKFSSAFDSFDDLKNDCVNFLFETILKFDSTRGTNAFSYFNVVAKNWLIIKTKQKSQRNKRNVSMDDPDALSAHERHIIEDNATIPSQDVLLEQGAAAQNVIKLLYEIRSKVKSENELTCTNSIITIFESIDDIDLLNKSALLLYMRELSGLTPKQLTTTMQTVKRLYRKLKTDGKNRLF